MNSNRPLTAMTASVLSCFNKTGPTSLYIFDSSSSCANSLCTPWFSCCCDSSFWRASTRLSRSAGTGEIRDWHQPDKFKVISTAPYRSAAAETRLREPEAFFERPWRRLAGKWKERKPTVCCPPRRQPQANFSSLSSLVPISSQTHFSFFLANFHRSFKIPRLRLSIRHPRPS